MGQTSVLWSWIIPRVSLLFISVLHKTIIIFVGKMEAEIYYLPIKKGTRLISVHETLMLENWEDLGRIYKVIEKQYWWYIDWKQFSAVIPKTISYFPSALQCELSFFPVGWFIRKPVLSRHRIKVGRFMEGGMELWWSRLVAWVPDFWACRMNIHLGIYCLGDNNLVLVFEGTPGMIQDLLWAGGITPELAVGLVTAVASEVVP